MFIYEIMYSDTMNILLISRTTTTNLLRGIAMALTVLIFSNDKI